jgi:predicted ATPase
LALGGLARVEVGEFVTAATGTVPDNVLVGRIWDRTHGNPFFVGQLVRLLETPGGEVETLATEVPGGVRDVIRHRVGLLPAQTVQVLRLAAVVGRDFEMDVLARVVGGDEEDVLAGVETALRAGLVIEQPETVGRYRFVHALVRETLYDELSALRRARLHRRVGEALEHRSGVDPLELAHHFWQAEPAGAVDKALEYVIRAADHAMDHLAYEQAEEQLRHALELVARLPAGADPSRLELELQTRLWLLLAPLRGYAHPEAGLVAARTRELCRELGEATQLAQPLWRLWAFHTVRAEFQPAEEYARELLEARESGADSLFLVSGHHGLGMVAIHRGQLAQAKYHLEQAVRLPSGDDSHVTDVFGHYAPAVLHSCLAVALALLGEDAAARQTSQVAAAIAAEVSHPFTSAMTPVFEAWMGVHLRDVPLARRAGKEGGAACEEGQYRMWGAAAKIIGGWARALQGEGAAGVAEASAALAQWEETGARMLRSFFLGLVGEAHRAAGKPHEALAVIDLALAVSQSIGEHFYDAELHRLRGELLAALKPEQTAEAETSLRQAIALAETQAARPSAQRARESLQRLTAASSDTTARSR